MRLHQWISHEIEQSKHRITRQYVIDMLADLSGVSSVTIKSADRGARIAKYDKAKAISKATDWKVSIVELCDEKPEEMLFLCAKAT